MPELMPSGPVLRLINARVRIRSAVLAIQQAELEARITDAFAGSEKARDVYGDLTEAARELVAAQDAFDAWCHENAVRKMNGLAEASHD